MIIKAGQGGGRNRDQLFPQLPSNVGVDIINFQETTIPFLKSH